MSSEQARVQYFDEENRHLDVFVQMTAKKGKPGEGAFNVELFFRPPIGIRPEPSEQPIGTNTYRYLARIYQTGPGCLFQEVRLNAVTLDKPDLWKEIQQLYSG